MGQEVPLNELNATLDSVSYPATDDEVQDVCGDVVLEYADGTERLSAVIDRLGSEQFDSRDELVSELYSVLPVEAVGEPGQAEGEG